MRINIYFNDFPAVVSDYVSRWGLSCLSHSHAPWRHLSIPFNSKKKIFFPLAFLCRHLFAFFSRLRRINDFKHMDVGKLGKLCIYWKSLIRYWNYEREFKSSPRDEENKTEKKPFYKSNQTLQYLNKCLIDCITLKSGFILEESAGFEKLWCGKK